MYINIGLLSFQGWNKDSGSGCFCILSTLLLTSIGGCLSVTADRARGEVLSPNCSIKMGNKRLFRTLKEGLSFRRLFIIHVFLLSAHKSCAMSLKGWSRVVEQRFLRVYFWDRKYIFIPLNFFPFLSFSVAEMLYFVSQSFTIGQSSFFSFHFLPPL